MRKEVLELIELGSLPPESSVASQIAEREALLAQVTAPLSLNEAKALASVLGPDECFGLAWSIVHLIESAPGWGPAHVPLGQSPFLPLLRSRLANAR